MRTLIINCKNYPEVLGDGSVKLALIASSVAKASGIDIIIAPPIPMLGLVASGTRARVFSQTVSSSSGDKTTGSIIPEAVKAAGGSGAIINHSESRKTPGELSKLVPRLRSLGLESCLCAGTSGEASRLSELAPTYIAVEPPQLIGTGVAVSRAKPELIGRTLSAVRRAGFEGKVLCGAGIISGEDVRRAVELGTEGVLVASSIVKARDWEAKVRELANSLK